ncbi:MAG: hypothetical protein R3Y24_16940 [Eubacteriales bacterium]
MNNKEREYQYVCSMNEQYGMLKNSCLTFIFTVTVTCLGFCLNASKVNTWTYCIPYLIIVPFSGRLAYWRYDLARKLAYLEIFHPTQKAYYHVVRETKGELQPKLISVLVNYETSILSIGIICLFIVSTDYNCELTWKWYVQLLIHILFNILIVYMTSSAYKLDVIKERYANEWIKVKDNLKEG